MAMYFSKYLITSTMSTCFVVVMKFLRKYMHMYLIFSCAKGATYMWLNSILIGERGGSVVECRTPEREVGGSKPTAAVLCPWARHFTPRKYWLITQEAVTPSGHDWKIVDWDVKPQHKQTKHSYILHKYDSEKLIH